MTYEEQAAINREAKEREEHRKLVRENVNAMRRGILDRVYYRADVDKITDLLLHIEDAGINIAETTVLASMLGIAVQQEREALKSLADMDAGATG